MTKTKELSVHNQKFNRGAADFESWFNNNKNLFYSELNALKKMVSDPESCVSIGIGNGLFAEELGIKSGVEPSTGMAELARARGIAALLPCYFSYLEVYKHHKSKLEYNNNPIYLDWATAYAEEDFEELVSNLIDILEKNITEEKYILIC